MPSPENQSGEEAEVNRGGKRSDSSRLNLASRVLEPDHPGMRYLKEQFGPQVVSEDPMWMTILSLVNDSRQLILSFPFTDQTVNVQTRTYFRTHYQGLLKKGRLPQEETFFRLALYRTLLAMVTNEDSGQVNLISSPQEKVPQDLLQKSVTHPVDPYRIRTNNTIAVAELPKEVWSPYVRQKVDKESGEGREGIIPLVNEKYAMMYLYFQAINNPEVGPLETVYFYMLLLDPTYADQRVRFPFRGVEMDERFRTLMMESIRYEIGVTYYSAHVDPGLRQSLANMFAKKRVQSSIGSAFFSRKERDVPPEVLKQIEKNLDLLMSEEDDPRTRIELSELPPLLHPQQNSPYKLPNKGIKDLIDRLENTSPGNDLTMFAYLRYLERTQKKE